MDTVPKEYRGRALNPFWEWTGFMGQLLERRDD